MSHIDEIGCIAVAAREPDMYARLAALVSAHRVIHVIEHDEIPGILARNRPALLIVALAVDDLQGLSSITRACTEESLGHTPCIYIGDTLPTSLVSTLAGQLFHAVSRDIGDSDLAALIGSAVTGRAAAPVRPLDVHDSGDAAHLHKILDAVHCLAMQREPEIVAQFAADAAMELTGADHAICLFHDAATGSLFGDSDEHGDDMRAVAGIIGFAARTGSSVVAERAGEDARYHGHVDGAHVAGDERVIAQPCVTGEGQVHAVMIATRKPGRAPFSALDQRLLACFARESSHVLDQLSLRLHAEEMLEHDRAMFRREAVEAHESPEEYGSPLRVSPAWIYRSYRLSVVLLIMALAYLSLGTIDQYTTGPAVVRVSGRIDITATRSGTIEAIHVIAGQSVREGQILARLSDEDERGALEHSQEEWETQLRSYLLDPGAAETRRELARLSAARSRAEARVEERILRAPGAGTISDIRIRPGQHLSPGEPAFTLITDASELSLIAFLPGSDGPLIERGMPMRLELIGYRYAYQELRVIAVASEVIGPTEARRAMGPQLADSVPLDRSVVLVRATLPKNTFEADGHRYRYHDGMSGRVELKIRSQRIITALIPGLERL